MPASANLTTLETVKTYLGITTTDQDTLLSSLIASVSEAVEHYCGRVFALDRRVEFYDGQATGSLVLRCRPVTEIHSIHDDMGRVFAAGTEIPATRLVLYPGEGVVRLSGGYFAPGLRNIRVEYTAGYDPIPPAIEQAATILVAHFRARASGGADAIASESLGSYTVSYDTGAWPHQARGLLAEWREASV